MLVSKVVRRKCFGYCSPTEHTTPHTHTTDLARQYETEAKRSRAKIYYTQNKVKILKAQREYYEKHKEEKKSYKRTYTEANKEKISEAYSHYYAANKHTLQCKHKLYQQQHKEQIAAWKREYQQENKDQLGLYHAKYVQEQKEKFLQKCLEHKQDIEDLLSITTPADWYNVTSYRTLLENSCLELKGVKYSTLEDIAQVRSISSIPTQFT